jgi:hypothetical protein
LPNVIAPKMTLTADFCEAVMAESCVMQVKSGFVGQGRFDIRIKKAKEMRRASTGASTGSEGVSMAFICSMDFYRRLSNARHHQPLGVWKC